MGQPVLRRHDDPALRWHLTRGNTQLDASETGAGRRLTHQLMAGCWRHYPDTSEPGSPSHVQWEAALRQDDNFWRRSARQAARNSRRPIDSAPANSRSC